MTPIPKEPPKYNDALHRILSTPARFQAVFPHMRSPTVEGRYIHWNKLRHLTPPGGITAEEWWVAVKWARDLTMKRVPINGGKPISFSNPDPLQEMLCDFDRNTSGRVPVSDQIVNPHTRDRYIISTLIEESITSSQLEGASTERKVASDMLRSGRKPRDKDEQMIFNNYLAMKYIRRKAKEQLTADTIVVLHRMVTDNTLDEVDAGRFRTDEDRVRVEDPGTNEVLYIPPSAEGIAQRMEVLCEFANGKHPGGLFIHPVIRAILLHFWLAYEHPFVDGNGRTARALFYWSMINSGYWLCEYISISRIVHQAPARYRNAFLYTETDDNDATYFVLYHLEAVLKAIDALHGYLRKKMEEMSLTQSLLKKSLLFNHRQLAILSHAIRNPAETYTIQSHANSHLVVYETARSDLMALEEMGLLMSSKVGNKYLFTAPGDLEMRLRNLTVHRGGSTR